jgi:hypothetical protein
LGYKTQKTSGIAHIRESNIQLQLLQIDGDLIIYAEFDKKNGIKDDTPLYEKSHHGILDLLVFMRKLDRFTNTSLVQ